MAAPLQHTLTRIDINGTVIRGLTTLALDPGIVRSLNAGGSALDPEQRSTTGIRPVVRFATRDLANALGAVFGGSRKVPHVPIAAAGSDVVFYWQNLAHGGARGQAGTNIKNTIKKGLIVPVSLRNADGAAELECLLYADYDGTNVPLHYEIDQDLPGSFDLHSPAVWRLTALKNGSAGTVLHHLTDLSVDFNVGVVQQNVSQSPYSLGCRVERGDPQLRFSTTDVETGLTAFPPSVGAQAAAGGLILYIGQYVTESPYLQTTGALTLTLAAGSVIYPVGIGLDQFPLQLELAVLAKGGDDIATAPLTYGTGASLPSVNVTPTLWGVGPAYDNATPVEVGGGRLDFGLNWEAHGPRTLPWNNSIVLPGRERAFRLVVAEPEYYASLADTSGRAVDTSFRLFLRQWANQSEPYSNAAEEHIKLNVTAGFIEPTGMNGAHGQRVAPELALTPLGDVLAVSTSQAIA